MAPATVLIIESDPIRQKTLSQMVFAAIPVDIEVFTSLDDAAERLSKRPPRLVVCPWEACGETLLAQRIDAHLNGTANDAPHLLVTTPRIDSGRIAAARMAGNTDLIPSDPLNLSALRNRIVLTLEGPATLAERLTRTGVTLRDALENLPGLRRRLAV